MQEKCLECGESTVWEQELGSAICTHCGTLSNPSQSVLASHIEHVDTSGHDYSQYWSNSLQGRSAIKGKNGWNLPGQDKEATYRRNTVQMHDFIRSVTSKLSSSGVTGRAQHVFDSAMQQGHFRWGRKAKLTAGASIAIALRESRKADSIRDIAYLLDESPVSIARSFTSVVQLLQLSLASADPSLHIPILQAHVASLVDATQQSSALPAALYKSLKALLPNIHGILHTATSLSSLVTRLDKLSELPTGPTACAIFILSLEAELGTSLPNAGALATALGARIGMSKRVVMERYKMIYDNVEEWIREVPWLEAHERKTTGKGKGKAEKGVRSKVAKRVVVARGLKDVVQFQDELWRKKMEGVARPLLSLECEEDNESSGDGKSGSPGGGGTLDTATLSQTASISAFGTRPTPQIKQLSSHQRAVETTSQFFLNPLALSSSSVPIVDTTGSGSGTKPDIDLFQHLLTVDDTALEHAFSDAAPSRLQRLVAVRGADVDDDELFEEGEMEGFFRTDEEISALRDALGWDPMRMTPEPASPRRVQKAKRKKGTDHDDPNAEGTGPQVKRTKRINMDALARVLDPTLSLAIDSLEDLGADDEFEDTRRQFSDRPPSLEASGQRDCTEEEIISFEGGDGEEVVGEWRPMSPGGGGFDDERYDA